MFVAQEVNVPSEWVVVHTFTSPSEGVFTDTGVADLTSYEYDAVASNVNGDSTPSDPCPVTLAATGITVVWVKPRAVLTRSHYMWMHEPCFYGWLEG